MNQTTATALGVGIFGGLATMLYMSTGTVLIWAAFVAWASFFAIGGTRAAVPLNITCNLFGVVVAWIVGLLILANPFPGLATPVWAGLLVLVSVVIYISASVIPAFSSVPAVTFGYAATFAYISQTPDVFSTGTMLEFSFSNVLINVGLSMIGGTFFAYGSAWLSGVLAKPAADA
ncbi:DUF1097 domain-containing protein [Poseidonocella sp. HB161398]|uniref:DUF1097 domain-containing protein n=1 Tax=Poseidonocella sp. HB161398 TaxID=2320855 RepID=UPI001486FA81|nr:DUF1097 domain-containing protein [Poseidonocella sp. HB161398]